MRGVLLRQDPITKKDTVVKYFPLVDPAELVLKDSSEAEVSRVKRAKYHIVTVNELLYAANVETLEELSLLPDSAGGSLRFDGAAFLVTLDYNDANYDTIPNLQAEFIMRVFKIKQTESKVYQQEWNPYPLAALQRSYAGSMFKFSQVGRFSRVSYQVILVQIVGAVVYLNVRTVILDYLCLIIMQISPYIDIMYERLCRKLKSRTLEAAMASAKEQELTGVQVLGSAIHSPGQDNDSSESTG